MDMSKVSVDIFGESYLIRGDAEERYIKEVGCLVDQRMSELKSKSPHLEMKRLAVLTAINLADELLQERIIQEEEGAGQGSARRTSELISLLDEALVGSSPL